MARKSFQYQESELVYRSTITMTRKMRDFLDEIASRCKDMGGANMSHTSTMRAILSVLMQLEGDVDWSKIKDERELGKRILAGLRKKRG